MATLQASCPNCAAPLRFRPGTMVAVCKACGSAVARGDRNPELIGQVAALLETGSPLTLGARGRWRGKGFELAGRVQVRHALGGMWDEWLLAYEDGHWGWLAEAQGKFVLSGPQRPGAPLPPPSTLQAGMPVDIGVPGAWVVAEVSEASYLGAEGELPFPFRPGERYEYADLSGPGGAFATLDFSEEPPLLFVGAEAPLRDLGIQVPGGFERGPKVGAVSLNCPHCAGPLTLRAPDQTLRVTCPSCHGLLDASQGKLSYLKSLQQPDPRMAIPLGSEGTLRGQKYACIGYLKRGCDVEGVHYPWGEYLLYHPEVGFRWLVDSEGHWSLAEPVSAGDLQSVALGARSFGFHGETFRRFQDVTAVVDGVWGEFYWPVEKGEKSELAEFIAPPRSLSQEVQRHRNGGQEVNWSLSTYLEPAEVSTAFGLKEALPEPRGISPLQPNPRIPAQQAMTRWMLAALALWVLMLMGFSLTHRNTLLYSRSFERSELMPAAPVLKPSSARGAKPAPFPSTVPTATPTADPEASDPVFFSNPIRIEEGHRNLAVTIKAPVENAWVGVEGALVSEETGAAELFEVGASYYHGREDGESWSEGGRSATVYLDAVPAGTYVLRLAPSWGDGAILPVDHFEVELRQGVMRWTYAFLALLAILLPPAFQGLRRYAFESRRWQDSDYSPYPKASGGDE